MTEQRKLGQFYMVMRTDGVISSDEFIKSMQQMTDEVRSEPSIPDEVVMLPGDKEIINSKKRLKEGIPLDNATITSFQSLSNKYSIELKLI
jgi:LDH2 family malate/lactate/ureidoglycolate dehydrogenase